MVCVLYCGSFNLFCNVQVCVCVGFVMFSCFVNKCTGIYCVFCIVITVFLYCFVYVYLFFFMLLFNL